MSIDMTNSPAFWICDQRIGLPYERDLTLCCGICKRDWKLAPWAHEWLIEIGDRNNTKRPTTRISVVAGVAWIIPGIGYGVDNYGDLRIVMLIVIDPHPVLAIAKILDRV